MKIVTNARKLIFLPEANAKTVAFPNGAVISDYGVDNTNPTVVVCNATENPTSWQGVNREGGYVIVNTVPEDVALEALAIFDRGGRTNVALQAALDFLVKKGCNDQYTTPHSFASTKLSSAGFMLSNNEGGIVKRDDRDQIPVWKNAEGQIFVETDGVRLIEPGKLVETYRNPDGSKIDLATIPVEEHNS